MNEVNGWKWVALILAALVILTGCFLFGSLIGGTVGYTIGRSVMRPRSFGPQGFEYPEPFEMPEPPMPHQMPQEERPWLGVYFQMTDEGAEIMDVVQGSPAEDAGLEAGDVITEVDGEAVTVANPLDVLIGRYEPGDRVRLTVLRDGDEEIVRVRLGTRPIQMPFDEEDLPFMIPPSPGEG
jgi:S1-C subfamily serine protease